MLTTEHATASRQRNRTALGVAGALIGTTAVLYLSRLTHHDLLVQARGPGLTPVPLGGVLVATVLGGVAAYGCQRAARRFTRPRAAFRTMVVLGLVLSSAAPLAAAADVATAAWLLALHAVVALCVLPTSGGSVLPGRRQPTQVDADNVAR